MDFSPVISGFATILTSGVVSAVVSYRLSLRKDEDNFKRQKIEELYAVFEKYDHFLGVHFLKYYTLFRGLQSYNEFNEEVIKQGAKTENRDALAKTELLIAIYFPILQKHLNAYSKSRSEVNNLIFRHRDEYKKGPINDAERRWVKPLSNKLQNLEDLGKELKKAIVDEAQKFQPRFRDWSIRKRSPQSSSRDPSTDLPA